MKFIHKLLIFLTLFYMFQTAIFANTNEFSANSVFNQLTHIITGVYRNLFDQVVRMPSQKISKSAFAEKQDGYIFNITGNKATIDLGKKDDIQQGMLLNIYREKDIYSPLNDKISIISVPLGRVVVKEVYEDSSTVFLSRFESKIDEDENNGERIFSVQEWDRVKRPVNKNEKLDAYAHILSLTSDIMHLEFIKDIQIGDSIQIIKKKKEAKHPITGDIVQLNPEKEAVIKITEIRDDRLVGKIIYSDEKGRFVVNDKVKVIKL